jgi:hypothetical protein
MQFEIAVTKYSSFLYENFSYLCFTFSANTFARTNARCDVVLVEFEHTVTNLINGA